ncbi:MAG TPA: DUF885 family protein [Lysobacter sp.]
MTTRRDFLTSALALACSPVLASCSMPDAAPSLANGPGDAALHALLDRMFQAQLRASPESISNVGLDHGAYADARHRLDDRSLAGRERSAREQRGFLRELDAIDRRSLGADARVNLDAARYLCALQVQGARQFGYGQANASRPYVVSQLSGAYRDVPELFENSHWIETRDDAEAYLSRLSALPATIDQDSERARADAARGVVPPGFIIDKAVSQLQAMRDAPPAANAAIAALIRRVGEQQLAGDWQTPATQVVQGPLRQAIDRQLALLESWRPRAVNTPGIARLPDGEAYYRWALQLNTTTPMNATELHRQGVEQVEELGARMDALLRKQGLSEGSLGARYATLAKDPRHLYPDTDAGRAQLLDDLHARLRDMQPRLPRYFARLPTAAPVVHRLPPVVAALRNPADAPQWEHASFFYHEGLPGHHLQAGLALESPRVPMLFKGTNLPAFYEGWALYAEQLVDEMGVHADDPLVTLATLRSFLLRAMHLVVDTGLHAQDWSRDRAAAYVGAITGLPAPAAASRVERYCAMPGQALSFKAGHNHWLESRARAQRRLGAKFDLRRFHDAALRHGAIPLQVHARAIDDWIAASDSIAGASPPPDTARDAITSQLHRDWKP